MSAVAFVAIAPMIYSDYVLFIKIGNISALVAITYGFLLAGRTIRQFIEKEKSKWD